MVNGARLDGREPAGSLGRSAFLDVEELAQRLDVVTIGQTGGGFAFFEVPGGKIVPAEFGDEAVPDLDVVLVKAPAGLITPLQNLGVTPARENMVAEFVVFHLEKLDQSPIGPAPQIFVIFGIEFARCMKTNFIQHPREIPKALRLILGALGFHAGNLEAAGPSRKRVGPLPLRDAIFRY